MTAPLSETVQALIAQAQIMSFEGWESIHPPDSIARFQAANAAKQFLTDDDLEAIALQSYAPLPLIPCVQVLRDQATDIVAEARERVLRADPTLTQPGGGLFPPSRAEACWRDFWHFLRCISYGMAGGRSDYTCDRGLQAMQQLYQALQVPLPAMLLGLAGLQSASLKRLPPTPPASLQPFFAQLSTQLAQFQEGTA